MKICKIDEHEFEDIHTYRPPGLVIRNIDRVFRWCNRCGLVHVDDYSDGKFIRPVRSFVPTGK